MNEDLEFSIDSDTLKKLKDMKLKMGFEKYSWNDWFNFLYDENFKSESKDNHLEGLMEKWLMGDFFDEWVRNFALNLNFIWSEKSAKNLIPGSQTNRSAVVIGRGPSLKKFGHLKKLVSSDYQGTIVTTDGALINCLKEGVTPERFPNFYVVSIDTHESTFGLYDDEIVNEYGHKINGIFSTVTFPPTAQRARDAGISIHWLHALLDYNEGKKSFNQISAIMTRAKNHPNGLPAIQTGGNAGTASWFVAWKILKIVTIGLIGIDHSWNENDSWETITTHGNAHLNTPGMTDVAKDSSAFKRLFPKIYNPEFNCTCILDPIFQYYSEALKEFISRSPNWVNTINATQGGCIFGHRIECMNLETFLSTNNE